jgi:hypothetical protein
VKPFVKLVTSLVGFATGLVAGWVVGDWCDGGALFTVITTVGAAAGGAIVGAAFGETLVDD